MATASDLTAFRAITEDGEPVMMQHPAADNTIEKFEEFMDDDAIEPGVIAQWYVPRTDDMLAEAAYGTALTTYPAADLFA